MKRANDTSIDDTSMKRNIIIESNSRKNEHRDNLLLDEENYENVDDIKNFGLARIQY